MRSLTAKTTDLYPRKKCTEKIQGQDGQDPVLTCPSAVKGYDVTVGLSAVLTQVTVSDGAKETAFSGLLGKVTKEWAKARTAADLLAP